MWVIWCKNTTCQQCGLVDNGNERLGPVQIATDSLPRKHTRRYGQSAELSDRNWMQFRSESPWILSIIRGAFWSRVWYIITKALLHSCQRSCKSSYSAWCTIKPYLHSYIITQVQHTWPWITLHRSNNIFTLFNFIKNVSTCVLLKTANGILNLEKYLFQEWCSGKCILII